MRDYRGVDQRHPVISFAVAHQQAKRRRAWLDQDAGPSEVRQRSGVRVRHAIERADIEEAVRRRVAALEVLQDGLVLTVLAQYIASVLTLPHRISVSTPEPS